MLVAQYVQYEPRETNIVPEITLTTRKLLNSASTRTKFCSDNIILA